MTRTLPFTELRWKLSEFFFRLSYRLCPDKAGYDFVLRHGIIATRERLAAQHEAEKRDD